MSRDRSIAHRDRSRASYGIDHTCSFGRENCTHLAFAGISYKFPLSSPPRACLFKSPNVLTLEKVMFNAKCKEIDKEAFYHEGPRFAVQQRQGVKRASRYTSEA